MYIRNHAIFSITYLIGCWCLNYVFGLLVVVPESTEIAAIEAGAAFVIPMLTAFILTGNHLIIAAGSRAIAKIIAIKRPSRTQTLKMRIARMLINARRRQILNVLILASFCATAYLLLSGVLDDQLHSAFWWVIYVQAIPLWSVIILCIMSVTHVYLLLKKCLLLGSRLSLFEVEKLAPAGDVMLTVFFVLSVAVGIYSLNAFFVDMPAIDIALISLGVLLTLVCLAVPLKVLQSSLVQKKATLLKTLNKQLSDNVNQSTSLENKRRLVDDTHRLQYVSDLLLVRKEISNITSIPISQPTIIKLSLLLFLPVLSWIGAGTVSQLLKLLS